MGHKSDLLVIGGGPGGISTATKAALEGRSVTIINNGPLMGYGIEGAFKSKAGFEISQQSRYNQFRSDVFGKFAEPDYSMVYRGMERSSATLTDMLEDSLTRLNIKLVQGTGRFVNPNEVEVNNEIYEAKYIIIGTGTTPRVLPGMSIDGRRIISSDEATQLKKSPKSMLIIGAGVIGCEFACIFKAMGTAVHLVDSQKAIMANEDPDLSRFLERAFSRWGIDVLRESRYQSLTLNENSVTTVLNTGEVTTDIVLLAVGRVACTAGLNLAAAGLETDKRGFIPTNDNMQTSVDHIYAVGDVGYRNTPVDLSLVHVAQAEGRLAAAHILGLPYSQNMDHVPFIIFTIPMIAGAGYNETTAREEFGDIRVGKYPYSRNHRAHTIQPPVGFVKLIVAPEGDDRILGIRVIGKDADTIIGAASILIERELPYTYLMDSMFPHPSLLECLQGAAHIIAGDALKYQEGEEFTYTMENQQKPSR